MGTQLPSPKNGQSPPIFDPCLLYPNGWMDQDATWYGGRPGPRPHCDRWGFSSSPCKKRGHSPPPHFSAHVCCVQMVGWIKMPLGANVGLGPGHIVLHGHPAEPHSHKRGHSPPFLAHVCFGQTVAHLSYCCALVYFCSHEHILKPLII